MKKFILIFSVFCAATFANAQIELKHGLLLGGGTGWLQGVAYSKNIHRPDGLSPDIFKGKSEYQLNAAIGYKFRFQKKESPFFFDLDLLLGAKKNKTYVEYFMKEYKGESNYFLGSYSGNHLFYHFSMAMTYSYKICNGLYAGLGIEPTGFHLDGGGDDRWKVDFPVVGKIGYDFHFMDISVVYKHGLNNTMKKSFIDKGRINDLQVQLFIPF